MAVPVSPPLLRDGGRMSRDEFLRRWELLPDLKHAELIGGAVHMTSPVSAKHHYSHSDFNLWLATYTVHTPGCAVGSEGTWLMGRDAPQPDLALQVLPEFGGQTTIKDGLLAGVPELIVEITGSSKRKDLGLKLDLYRRSGVQEYITVLVERDQLIWRELCGESYQEIPPAADGVQRSRVFPGLWLDASAMWRRDLNAVLVTLQGGLATPEHAAFIKTLDSRKL